VLLAKFRHIHFLIFFECHNAHIAAEKDALAHIIVVIFPADGLAFHHGAGGLGLALLRGAADEENDDWNDDKEEDDEFFHCALLSFLLFTGKVLEENHSTNSAAGQLHSVAGGAVRRVSKFSAYL
jgi:hypothetical protein